MKTTTPKTSRKPAAKPPHKPRGTPGLAGKLTREETQNLLMQARDAFAHQKTLKRLEPGITFDEWRRDMVMDRVGKSGISQINRSDWRTVKSWFLELSGLEDKAFALLLKTGQKTDHPTNPNDTFETAETYVALIQAALADHLKVTIEHPKGHLKTGWFLAAARQRTAKPTLAIDTLAARLDPATLHGLLSHLKNHISTREGRAIPALRTKRIYPKKPDPGEMSDPAD